MRLRVDGPNPRLGIFDDGCRGLCIPVYTLNEVERLRRNFRAQVTNTAIPVPKPYSRKNGQYSSDWVLGDVDKSGTECESRVLVLGCQQDFF